MQTGGDISFHLMMARNTKTTVFSSTVQIKESGGINRMIKIDMWYGDDHKEADKIDITFYDLDCEYRGNIYKNGKMIGDYTCDDSVELEKNFPQLTFNWD